MSVNCELCGLPMAEGEEMFKFHGYSSPCPGPMLPRPPGELEKAQALTAELQKENTRLTKLLYEFFQLAGPHVGIATRSKMWAALNPPKGGAVQKGLSKEKE